MRPLLLVLLLAACGPPPSWQQLLAAKIRQEYPNFNVQPQAGGALLVRRPGQADKPVDVDDIARFCQRGPRDCDYATDRMLLDLRAP